MKSNVKIITELTLTSFFLFKIALHGTCMENAKIPDKNNNRKEIIIMESLLIKQRKHLINIQAELKVFK